MDLLKLTRTYRSARRLRQVVNVFLKHGFGRIIDQLYLGKYVPMAKRLRTFGQWPSPIPSVPERLRMAFEELGPSFIKLAQILSSRPDLITVPVADEFRKLQDRVPPFPAGQAETLVEEELKKPLSELFRKFGESPVAAASIAQVHPAELIDGTEVVVKIQRPGITEQIETDITILMTLARLLERHVPEARFYNPVGIIEEFSKTVRKELDFTREARNCSRFRKNFEDSPEVYIPKLFPELTTGRILVMEKVSGVRIDDIPGIDRLGIDRKKLVAVSLDAYFKMILRDGFFHADPHPGNLMVLPDGRLAFIDFGIVGWVTPEMIETMGKTFLAFIGKNFDLLIDQYIALGYVSEDVDIDRFREDFRHDLTEFLEPFYGMTLKEINLADYLDTLTHIGLKHRMKIPADLLLVNKAMLIMENIGRQLDPEFDFFAAAEPYAAKIAKERYTPSRLYEKATRNLMEIGDFIVLFPKQIRSLLRKTLRGDLQVKLTHIGIDRLINDMDRSTNRITFGMIISAILVSSAIMHSTNVGPKIFGLSILGIISFFIAFLMGVWLLVSIIRSGRL